MRRSSIVHACRPSPDGNAMHPGGDGQRDQKVHSAAMTGRRGNCLRASHRIVRQGSKVTTRRPHLPAGADRLDAMQAAKQICGGCAVHAAFLRFALEARQDDV